MRALFILLAACGTAGCGAKQHVPPGTPGSWLVAANASIWYQPDGPDGGVGWELLAGKAVLPHLLVGARGTALAVLQIRLFDDDKDTTRSGHLDVGPIIGTAAGWGRLSASATAGPLATRITHDDHTR